MIYTPELHRLIHIILGEEHLGILPVFGEKHLGILDKKRNFAAVNLGMVHNRALPTPWNGV